MNETATSNNVYFAPKLSLFTLFENDQITNAICSNKTAEYFDNRGTARSEMLV